jgi:antirestriction protein ArdC
MSTFKADTYQRVTDAIVAQIEAGLSDGWKRPWKTVGPNGEGFFPVSVDGHTYRGLNTVILMSRGMPCNVWGTYKAWQGKGAQVRGGEKGTLVTYWQFNKVKDEETGKETTVPFVRGYTVFNAAQVDGWSPKTVEAAPVEQRHTEAHAMLKAYRDREGIALHHGGDRAFYSPMADHIAMPELGAFVSEEAYLATLAHEQGHSTGHGKRLNREFGRRFGDQAYAFEELVAELTAAMTMAGLGLALPEKIDDQHAKYVKSWLDVLKADKRAIFTAASKAQAAADLIAGRTQELAIAA